MRVRIAVRDEPFGQAWQDVTVCCGLQKLVKCDWSRTLKKMINEDVEAVSEVLIKFSVYFDRICFLNRDKPSFFVKFEDSNHFRSIFTRFKNSTGKLRKTIKSSMKGRTKLLVNSLTDFETATKNNIAMNLRKRLIRYYTFVDIKTDPAKFVDKLLIDGKDERNFPNIEFYGKNAFFLIPALFKMKDAIDKAIQSHGLNVPSGLRSFAVIPQKQTKANFIHYNISASLELTNRRLSELNDRIVKRNQGKKKADKEKKHKKLVNPKTIEEARDLFAKLFNFAQFERFEEKADSDDAQIKRKFALRVSTDGISARILMRKRSKPETPVDGDTDVHSALDPGFKLMFAAVSECQHTLQRKTLLFSSKKYHFLAGMNRRKLLRTKWQKQIEDEMRRDRERKKIRLSGRRLQNHQMKFFDAKKKLAFKKKLKRLRQNSDICQQKTLRSIVSTLCPPNLTTTVFYGNGISFPINGINIRSIQPPLVKFYEAFKQLERCNLIDTNEFMTSRRCSNCDNGTLVTKPKRGNRAVNCKKCRKTMNRDHNAAVNILKVGQRALN